MDKNRWLVNLMLVVNVVLIGFAAKLLVDLKSEVRGLKETAVTRADLQTVQMEEADLSSPQAVCTRCHTELRFTGAHGTQDELVHIIRRMRTQPDASIEDREMDKVHAAIELLKCTQCHSSDTIKKLAQMDTVQRRNVIEKMVEKEDSRIPAEESEEILNAFESMSSF